MKVRVLIGVVLIAALIGILALDGLLLRASFPWASAVVLWGLVTLAAFELFRMIAGRVPHLGVLPATVMTGSFVAVRILDLAVARIEIPPPLYAFALLSLVFLPEILWPRLETAGLRVAGRLLGIVYLMPLTLLIDVGVLHGALTMGWLVLSIKGSDIGGFLAGKLIGGVGLAPRVSPKKTVAGLCGGLVLTTAATVAGRGLLDPPPSPLTIVVFGVVLGLAGPLGDLSESVLKRSFGVKDSAVLLGDAGGALDLLDSLVLSVPVGYLFLVHVFPTV
ncbi:MAG: phosphatidate cytidylyltransferase [Planctomycetota bacterium]